MKEIILVGVKTLLPVVDLMLSIRKKTNLVGVIVVLH